MSEFPKILTKGDARRTANTIEDQVRFQFDGFTLPAPEPTPTAEPPASAGSAEYDPAEHTVAEVQDYLAAADDAERDRVLSAERGGKARSSLLD